MNENNIIQALTVYDGTQESLEKTVEVLSNELGPNWTDDVFQQLGDLSVELKEKLNHAFNYYASLTAWQEAEAYLNQEDALDLDLMDERLPVLKHWLDFFGEAGQNLYQQLEDRCHQEEVAMPTNTPPPADDTGDVETAESESETSEPITDDIVTETQESQSIPEEVMTPTEPMPGVQSQAETSGVENVEQNETDKAPSTDMNNSGDGFVVQKAEREIKLLADLQAWLAARCVQLGDIETFAYPYYGLVVDMMRQVEKDIQAVLELPDPAVVGRYSKKGLEYFNRQKQAVSQDIQTAVENCESDTTALIEKGMDMDKVKKTLGDLDLSGEKEYLGPAPDGFELMEDEPIDENAVKEQYQQLEESVQEHNTQDISVASEKTTSQNPQNGVQRKLSFSLKAKKG